MTHIHLAVLGTEDSLSPFVVLLANELGLAGLQAGVGPASAGGIWLGLWPQARDNWALQTWAPDSLGASIRLAADMHRGLRGWLQSAPKTARYLSFSDAGVGTVWPSVAPPPRSSAAEAIVTLPAPAALVRDGIVTAVAARLAKTLAATLARHVGVAGQQLMKSPVPVVSGEDRAALAETAPPTMAQPEMEQPEPAQPEADESETAPAEAAPAPSATAEQASEPTAPASEPEAPIAADAPTSPSVDAENAQDASPTASATQDDPPRPRRRSERMREGLQGSRTYEHPPWVTSEHLLPSTQPQPAGAPQPVNAPQAAVPPSSFGQPQPHAPPQPMAPPPALP